MGVGDFISMAVIGLIVGLVARLLMPGKDPMGLIMTAILGIAGSFLGTFLGRKLLGPDYQAGWLTGLLMSVLGAFVLLFLYRILFRKRE